MMNPKAAAAASAKTARPPAKGPVAAGPARAIKKPQPNRIKVTLPDRYLRKKTSLLEEEEKVELTKKYEGPSISEVEQEIIRRKKEARIELDEMLENAKREHDRIIREAKEIAFNQVKEAEDEYQRILENTKVETEQLIAGAEQKAAEIETEVEKKREEIFEQFKTRGYKEGWDEGYREGEQELKKINERLESIIRAVTEKRVEIIESSERQLVEIIRLVSRKVVKKIIDDHDDIIIYNIKDAVSRIRDKSHLTIKVNFSDLKLALEKKQEIIGMIENVQKVEIIEDSLLEPGSCVIITDFGEIDARVSNQLARIEDRVLDMEYKP